MTYQESKDYLYGLGHELSVKKFGLSNTHTLLRALGNPEKRFFKVQIAGTNGKGSTAAFLSSITTAAGIETGLFTSPHLIEPTERIRVNDKNISTELFAKHAIKIRELSEQLVNSGKLKAVPTFFEQITAIGLSIFAEAGINLAILEVGLGGRFDATTAARAEIAVITPIDFDHTKILGNSLSKIAIEKAEIIRADSNAVLASAQQTPEALEIILNKCQVVNIAPKLIDINPDLPKLSLIGEHQKINASLAQAIAMELNQHGFIITPEHIAIGLKTAKHPGRLEMSKEILYDGAHNLAGAKVLADYLQTLDKPITLIFGAMRDKDITGISGLLFPLAEQIILTTVNQPRALTAAEITQLLPEQANYKFIHLTNSVSEALKKAKQIGNGTQIVVTGSLYLVGEAQKLMQNHG